jgi:hypothetical protein
VLEDRDASLIDCSEINEEHVEVTCSVINLLGCFECVCLGQRVGGAGGAMSSPAYH